MARCRAHAQRSRRHLSALTSWACVLPTTAAVPSASRCWTPSPTTCCACSWCSLRRCRKGLAATCTTSHVVAVDAGAQVRALPRVAALQLPAGARSGEPRADRCASRRLSARGCRLVCRPCRGARGAGHHFFWHIYSQLHRREVRARLWRGITSSVCAHVRRHRNCSTWSASRCCWSTIWPCRAATRTCVPSLGRPLARSRRARAQELRKQFFVNKRLQAVAEEVRGSHLGAAAPGAAAR
jgi:hypothetical protein